MKNAFNLLFLLAMTIALTACSTSEENQADDIMDEAEIEISNEMQKEASDNNTKDDKVDEADTESQKNGEPEAETEAKPDWKATVAFAECLVWKWVKLYWTSWCSHCKNQKEILWEDAMGALWFVDCDQDREDCQEAKIQLYPTWIINGQQYQWVRSLAEISEKSWCAL